jgi:phosphatidylserine decarboxylase
MATRGELRAAWFVPGDLFSVNRTTADGVANLFARNERVVCCFEDGSLPHALLLIGALNVGSMDTVWHGEVAPRQPRRVTALPTTDSSGQPLVAERGDEMGRFNMGSTVILLFPKGSIDWNPQFVSGRTVRMGEVLGHRRG